MKTYKEVASSVFERRTQYEKEQKRKKTLLARTLTPVCCLCLAACIGVGIWQGRPKQPAQTLQDAVYPGLKDNFDELNGESPTDPQTNNKIVIHKVDSLSGNSAQLFDLAWDDFISMEARELNDYYGVELFGQTPAGWLVKEEVGGIYRRASGELYWDFNTVTYESTDKSLTITVARETKDWFCLYDFIAGGEMSTVNNWQVALGQTPEGAYQADFLYQDVGFRVFAEGFSREEFISVLSSLIV